MTRPKTLSSAKKIRKEPENAGIELTCLIHMTVHKRQQPVGSSTALAIKLRLQEMIIPCVSIVEGIPVVITNSSASPSEVVLERGGHVICITIVDGIVRLDDEGAGST
jgi:hypothetical protein